jgi:hypothetical protein
MKTFKKGNEANLLEILVDNVDIKPFSEIKRGMLDDGIVLKFGRYNLDDVLCQMLDDYGEDELINRIKALE